MRPLHIIASGLCCTAGVSSVKADNSFMVSAQFMVTAEPQEGSDTVLGINVVPIVLEYAATTRYGVRANAVYNLNVAGSEYAAAERGLGLTLPIYLSKTAADGRTYLGPHTTFTRNPLVDGHDLTIAGEFGMRWPIADSLSLNLTVQAGATRNFRPEGDTWDTHLGIYPGLGYWPAL